MFVQAGFNPRADRLGVVAMIYRASWRDARRAELIRFECGDLCWYGKGGGLSWGTVPDLHFKRWIWIDHRAFGPAADSHRMNACDLATRKRVWVFG